MLNIAEVMFNLLMQGRAKALLHAQLAMLFLR